jgi:hypothetical protein
VCFYCSFQASEKMGSCCVHGLLARYGILRLFFSCCVGLLIAVVFAVTMCV